MAFFQGRARCKAQPLGQAYQGRGQPGLGVKGPGDAYSRCGTAFCQAPATSQVPLRGTLTSFSAPVSCPLVPDHVDPTD